MNHGKDVNSVTSGGRLEQTEVSSAVEAPREARTWPYETVRALNGNCVRRLRSSLFHWGALVAFIAGIILVAQEVWVGGFLALTLAPFLLLYPLVRFLFGGKDSAVAVVTTVIVEHVLKDQIGKAIDKESRK